MTKHNYNQWPPLRLLSWSTPQPYDLIWQKQQDEHAQIRAGQKSDCLMLLEHLPVITMGRSSDSKHLLATPEQIAAAGIQLRHSNRGGSVTYHGPGQLVGYPLLALRPAERDLRLFASRLENVLLQTLNDFGICGQQYPKERGIWVNQRKIAALGVHMRQWTSLHGFAINLDVDLSPFKMIVPCGLPHGQPIALADLMQPLPAREKFEHYLLQHFTAVFKRQIISLERHH